MFRSAKPKVPPIGTFPSDDQILAALQYLHNESAHCRAVNDLDFRNRFSSSLCNDLTSMGWIHCKLDKTLHLTSDGFKTLYDLQHFFSDRYYESRRDARSRHHAVWLAILSGIIGFFSGFIVQHFFKLFPHV